MQSENYLRLEQHKATTEIERQINKACSDQRIREEKANEKYFARGQEVCKQSVSVNAKRLKNNIEREGFALKLIEMGAVMLTGCIGIDEVIEESALILADLKRDHEGL